jgi:hypothetical protein
MVDTLDGNLEAKSAQAVIEACCEVGLSVNGISMASGFNVIQVQRWMSEHGIDQPTSRSLMPTVGAESGIAPEFVQLPLAPAAPESRDIWIEIRRGNTAIKVDWPAATLAPLVVIRCSYSNSQ